MTVWAVRGYWAGILPWVCMSCVGAVVGGGTVVGVGALFLDRSLMTSSACLRRQISVARISTSMSFQVILLIFMMDPSVRGYCCMVFKTVNSDHVVSVLDRFVGIESVRSSSFIMKVLASSNIIVAGVVEHGM